MDAIRTGKHLDQLRKRREQVVMTLQHIENEQQEAEENTDWLDRAAYESRIGLLERLSKWYIDEMDEIEKALKRAKQGKYGFCLACHKAIEVCRLDLSPETAFCSGCQEMREELQSA